jgi:rhodanese-related sulfurtransferase
MTVDELVHRSRGRIRRVGPLELDAIGREGGLLVDIRPEFQRAQEGTLPGAVCVERNVLEWRLDPTSPHRLPDVTGYDQPVVVICSEGYASSLAAATLADMGYVAPADLVGGYCAWRAWFIETNRQPRALVPTSFGD